MKITKQQLKQIIKEELENELREGVFTDLVDMFAALNPTMGELAARRTANELYPKMSSEEKAAFLDMNRIQKEMWVRDNRYRLESVAGG